MHDRTVIAGTQLGGEVARAATEQRGQFVGVIVDQSASNNVFPTTMAAMVTGGQFTLPTGMGTNAAVSAAPANPTGIAIGLQTTGATWYLTMTAGVAGSAPTFACT